jgi:hypothetical protein
VLCERRKRSICAHRRNPPTLLSLAEALKYRHFRALVARICDNDVMAKFPDSRASPSHASEHACG